MSNNYNTILIKRRTSGSAGAPGSLSGGELAFNEVDSTLYYGSNAGVISIAGSGAYVNRTTSQTISGDKTFTSLTTLSSTTFSPDSVIDFGGNVLTNVAEPSANADATTKLYVDTAISTLGSSGSSATAALSTEVYNTFVKLTDDRAVTLSGGLDVTSGLGADTITTTGNADIGGNLTVTGSLSVLGTQVIVNTETVNISGTSTQIDIVNNGTDTGLTVNQTGEQDVAEFKDDGNTALIIKGSSSTPGYVGIGTANPNEKLTVTGSISATGTLYAASGMEIAAGGGDTTLYVENGKIGVNTEAPNEELTVVGSISATEDIFANNVTFSGTTNLNSLDISCFSVDSTGNVSTCGTLTVGGATTLNNTLSVTGVATFDSAITASNTLDVIGASTFASSVSAQGALTIDGVSTFGGLMTINANTTTTGSISGTANNSYLVDFIIDGGTF